MVHVYTCVCTGVCARARARVRTEGVGGLGGKMGQKQGKSEVGECEVSHPQNPPC